MLLHPNLGKALKVTYWRCYSEVCDLGKQIWLCIVFIPQRPDSSFSTEASPHLFCIVSNDVHKFEVRIEDSKGMRYPTCRVFQSGIEETNK